MKRENAIFKGSRLYRQAEEGSNKLAPQFTNKQLPFNEIFKGVLKSYQITFSNEDEIDKLVSFCLYTASDESRKIAPEIGIPIIMQMIVDYYFGPLAQEPPWLGTALKRALALISGNLYTGPLIRSKSLKPLERVIILAGVLDQIEIIGIALKLSGDERFSLVDSRLRLTDQAVYILREFYASFGARGRMHRTLQNSTDAIWKHPRAALKAIGRVLRGESPKDQEAFDGTIFKDISRNEPVDFWAGMWMRLNMCIASYQIRSRVSKNPNGITVFQEFPATIPTGADNKLLQEHAYRLFWNPDWYITRVNEWPANMIVERPIVRVTASEELFVTAFPVIADSLNWFIESSVMGYTDAGGVGLSNSVFQRLISAPFEKSVCDCLNRFGFIAGKVKNNRLWLVEDQVIELSHPTDARFPGEIDVLAYKPDKGLLLVLECKVLKIPYSFNRFRNMYQKLGGLDVEGFHAKLARKVEWIKRIPRFSLVDDRNFIGVVLLDRKLPGGMNLSGDTFVIPFELFERFLEEQLSAHE